MIITSERLRAVHAALSILSEGERVDNGIIGASVALAIETARAAVLAALDLTLEAERRRRA